MKSKFYSELSDLDLKLTLVLLQKVFLDKHAKEF